MDIRLRIVKIPVVLNHLKILIEIDLASQIPLCSIKLLLICQTLHQVVLLIFVFVLGVLPSCRAFQVPHVGVVCLDARRLFTIFVFLDLALLVPVLALVLLD